MGTPEQFALIVPSPPALATGILCRLAARQRRWSEAFDKLLPVEYRVDGNRDFIDHLVAPYLSDGAAIYDIGGGKNPLIHREVRQARRLHITGVDIDKDELAASPNGAYDRQVCADITCYRGEGAADLVICQALLEHVRDTDAAISSIASILKSGGRALLFIPSRNAWFARLNLLLPESWKRAILFAVFPHAARDQGFPAHYDRCTPRQMAAIAQARGLTVERSIAYFRSSYFSFFFPLHFVWRVWLILFRRMAGDQAAETFSLVLRKE